MKIDRSELMAELEAFALGGNGLIVGPPGAGKSYALAALSDRLKSKSIPHLVLPVERLGSATQAEIEAVLQKSGDFVTLLQKALGDSKTPAVLIFDGFDAARGENERAGIFQMILRAVTGLRGSWNIIVSVRAFDAKKSHRLLELFHDSNDLANCRQFSIPSLTAKELQQAFQQIPGLQEIYANGTADFQALLNVPFNIWLIELVLKAGAKKEEFSQITSEVQLLEMYWNYRVRQASHSEDREFLLKNATAAMVGDRKLSIRRDRLYVPEVKSAWEALLSDEVIAETVGRETAIAFTHNILFDYAVSVYHLDSDPNRFAKFVAEQPGRPLFLRPSLVYHFTRLWHFERSRFWSNFWSIIQQEAVNLRQIVRLVLPTVIINEALSLEDVGPLLERLRDKKEGGTVAAAFVLQAIHILSSKKTALWASFIHALCPYLDTRFAWDAGMIAKWITESDPSPSPEALADCGSAGRALMQWAWNLRPQSDKKQWLERLVAFVAVPLIARTYATSPTESRERLESILQVFDEPEFSIDCIYRLCNEIGRIIKFDASFATTIYEKVFGYQEKSDKITSMGGHVMPLMSNRRQDYGMCRYVLIKEFPLFINVHPLAAIIAGARSIQAFQLEEHVLRHGRAKRGVDDLAVNFSFRGITATYVEDGSAIWDHGSYPDKERQIADKVFEWIENAALQNNAEQLNEVLDLCAFEIKLAFMWARLLLVGASRAETVGPRIWEIAKASQLFAENDILLELGTYLEKTSKFLLPEQLLEIEKAIVDIGKGVATSDAEFFKHRKRRLLARIPASLLVTEEAKALLKEMETENDVPENRPLFSFNVTSQAYTEEKFLEERGVKLDLPANQAVRELYRPLVEWREKNKPESALDKTISSAMELLKALSKGEVEETLSRTAWSHLASFASDALRQTASSSAAGFEFLRSVVLASANHKDPEPNAKYDLKWDHPSWSPAPRNEAAQALPWLTHLREDLEALSAIKKLLNDPVPSVRFLLACELWRLVENSSSAMWQLFEELIAAETNEVVFQGVAVSLWRLISFDREKTLKLIQMLLNRLGDESEGDENARSQLICMVVDFAIWEDSEWAKELIKNWQNDPLKFPASVARTGYRLIEYITPQNSGVRFDRARILLLQQLDCVAKALPELQKIRTEINAREYEQKWKMLYGVIDQAVMGIYFAADVDKSLRENSEEGPLSDQGRWQFFQEAWPVLEKILNFRNNPETGVLLAPTAHHFVELLRGVLKYDPARIVGVAADVVNFSKRFNYNLDVLAMGEIVGLVEAILADYREAIQDDKAVQNLLSLLDAFVEAGWPQALNLVWRLDELYR
jgi:hypothetical protein